MTEPEARPDSNSTPKRSFTLPPTGEPGMLIIFTGDGKGKTSAALGCALRALGHGWKVLMLQFVKGDWPGGEVRTASKLRPEFEIFTGGAGFVGSPGDRRPREIHRQAALATLTRAAEKIGSGEYQLIILDEICCAIDLGLLDLSKVMELIETRPPSLHLILTGRNAPRQLVDRADLVTEMKEIRHPFSQGLPARAGIDY